MRIKFYALMVLFICLLLFASSADAQPTRKGVANIPIGEISPAQQDITAGQAGTTVINMHPKA